MNRPSLKSFQDNFPETLTVEQYREQMKEHPQLAFMRKVLIRMNIAYRDEYKFDSQRKFRFDLYFEANGLRIGLEYDGLFSKKSRHTTVTGFSKDQEKFNLAAINKIFVLRYSILNYKNLETDLTKMLAKNG